MTAPGSLERSLASKPHAIVARPAPRKLILEGQVPSGYLWDILLRVSDLAARQRKKIALYFNSKLEKPDVLVARILLQGPDELALTQAMKRDGTDSKHAVSLKVWRRIKEDFPQPYVYLTMDAGRPWLEKRRPPLKTKGRH